MFQGLLKEKTAEKSPENRGGDRRRERRDWIMAIFFCFCFCFSFGILLKLK